jgi:hypothetical protein
MEIRAADGRIAGARGRSKLKLRHPNGVQRSGVFTETLTGRVLELVFGAVADGNEEDGAFAFGMG